MLGDGQYIDRCGCLGDLLTAGWQAKEAATGFVLGRWSHCVGVVSAVDEQSAAADFNCLDSIFARAVNLFECFEIKLLVCENVVVAELVPRLLHIELVLEHVYFIGQLLQLVEKLSLLCIVLVLVLLVAGVTILTTIAALTPV